MSKHSALRYRKDIDGLRALAVLPVLLFHAGFNLFPGGYTGVDIFFVISGYLITGILLNEMQQQRFSMLSFYERRARRILPALFAVVLCCLPLAWFSLLPADMYSFSQSLVALAGFVSNIFFWSERGYFGTATELKPLIHTWSLAIEEQYYLLFPLLLLLLAKSERRFMLVLSFICAASFILCIWITALHADSAFYLLPTRLWQLMVGSIVAGLMFYRPEPQKPAGKTACLLAWCGLAMLLYAILYFSHDTAFPGIAAVLPTLGTALLIYNLQPHFALARLLSLPLFTGIGLISYSLYLWHQPLFAFYRHLTAEQYSWHYALLIVLSVVLAYLSWCYIEQPWRNKQRFSRHTVFASALSGLLFITAVGFAGWYSNGFMARYTAADQALLQNFIQVDNYNAAKFDALQLAEFSSDGGKLKVILIGDSYAKDLVNAVYSSELQQHVSLSTYQINADCGNLYLPDDFSLQVKPAMRTRCKAMAWYDNAQLQQRMQQADVIWLSSQWHLWVAQRVAQSVQQLQHDFAKPVLVFGSKKFGTVSAKQLLEMTLAQRIALRNPLSTAQQQVQAVMRQELPPQQFVDLSTLLCNSESQCPLFTADGELLSHDGEHLTPAGAKHLGSLLYQDIRLQRQ
ncbi:acyltransferase family protein [Arsukibacterium ikkense]|uniref:acyltransferase family protein n=1 Tax=Arsukibacterium ikkense TaxID=336831 RepID=UPI000699E7CA|nr:acyltransferase family protein [Arsukibacterium ikkense]